MSARVSGSRFQFNKEVRDNLRAYLFVLPWIIGLLAFIAYPMLASFYFSMTDYDILNPPKWVGLNNFEVMFTSDPLYWKSVWNTVYYSIFSVVGGLAVALFLAVLLHQSNRGVGFYRTAFYLPSLMPAVAGTLLLMVILDPRLGLLNTILSNLGFAKVGWLRSSTWSKPALILLYFWRDTGQPMLIFLAALKDVPRSLMEAAEIDGANPWQRFRNVVVPLITPAIFFNLVIGIIYSFQVFTQAFIAGTDPNNTGTIGPLNTLLVYMIHLYRSAFRYFEMGYASAMALVLFLMLVLITLLLVRTADYWVFYEADGRGS